MPRLPTKFDLGSPASEGPAGGPPNLAFPDTGEAVVGRAASGIGNAIEGIGEEEAKRADTLDALKYEAYRRPRIEGLVDEFHKDNDYKTFEPRFQQQSAQINADALGLVRNAELRKQLQYKSVVETNGALRRVLTYGTHLRRQDEYAQADDRIGEMMSPLLKPDVTPETAEATLREGRAAIDLGLHGNLYDYAQAHRLKEKHITGLHGILPRVAENRLWDDPYGTLNDLRAGGDIRSRKDGVDLEPALVARESGGVADLVNKSGYAGLYQFGAPRLADLGLYTPGKDEDVKGGKWTGTKWSGEFKIPGFPEVKTLEDFKSNPEAQKAAFGQHMEMADAEIDKAGLDKWEGKTVGGVAVTRNGLRAMLHLGGLESTRKALESGGRTNPKDDNGTSVLDYAKLGEGQAGGAASSSSPWAALYSQMSPEARSHLITRARTALSATLQQDIGDALVDIESGREPKRDAAGFTAFDKAARILNPNQLQKASIAREAATMKARVLYGDARRPGEDAVALSDLDETALANRVNGVVDEKMPDASLKSATKVQKDVAHIAGKLLDGRRLDPGQWALGTTVAGPGGPMVQVGEDGELALREGEGASYKLPPPREVRQIYELVTRRIPEVSLSQNADGAIDVVTAPGAPAAVGQQARAKVIAAMLAAQDRVGIPEYNQRVVSKRQAADLLQMPDPTKISEKEYGERLRAASDRFHQVYGPQWGDRAFKDAVALIIKGKPYDDAATTAIGKLAKGESLQRADIRSLNKLDEIDRIGRAFEQPWSPQEYDTQHPAISPYSASTQSASDLALSASRQANAEPSEERIKWLRRNPGEWRRFDMDYGKGASAEILKKPAAVPSGVDYEN